MTSGDTGSNDEMMAQLNEQLAPVISNYGTTVVTDTVTDADLLAALTAAGLTGEQQQAVLGAVGVAMGKALQNDTPAMVQGVAGTVSGAPHGPAWQRHQPAARPAWTSLPAAVPSWPAVQTPT